MPEDPELPDVFADVGDVGQEEEEEGEGDGDDGDDDQENDEDVQVVRHGLVHVSGVEERCELVLEEVPTQ